MSGYLGEFQPGPLIAILKTCTQLYTFPFNQCDLMSGNMSLDQLAEALQRVETNNNPTSKLAFTPVDPTTGQAMPSTPTPPAPGQPPMGAPVGGAPMDPAAAGAGAPMDPAAAAGAVDPAMMELPPEEDPLLILKDVQKTMKQVRTLLATLVDQAGVQVPTAQVLEAGEDPAAEVKKTASADVAMQKAADELKEEGYIDINSHGQAEDIPVDVEAEAGTQIFKLSAEETDCPVLDTSTVMSVARRMFN